MTHSHESHRRTAFDVTVVSPLAVAVVSRSAREAGAATADAVEKKLGKYKAMGDCDYSPFAIDTYGGLHETAVEVIRFIARRQCDFSTTPLSFSFVFSRILQRLSLSLQRSNAQALLRSDPRVACVGRI